MNPSVIQISEFHELLCLFLVVLVGVVVGFGAIFSVSLARWLRDQRLRNQLAQFDIPMPFIPSAKPRHFLIERPNIWLAIKGNDTKKVQTALGLHHAMQCSWEEGLIEARDHKLFISPPVAGWILVVGSDLPEPGDDVDKCFHFLTKLSKQVGHLQYFCANRTLNQHAWAIVDKGQVFRAYAWTDQTVWNQGPITAAEKDLGLGCFPYLYRPDFSQRDVLVSNTEKVNALAARWSVDPNAVAENAWTNEPGIVGNFPPSNLL
jgi:hypothetical protein